MHVPSQCNIVELTGTAEPLLLCENMDETDFHGSPAAASSIMDCFPCRLSGKNNVDMSNAPVFLGGKREPTPTSESRCERLVCRTKAEVLSLRSAFR